MSSDEQVVFWAACAVAILVWLIWGWTALAVLRRYSRGASRLLLVLTPLLCAGVLYLVLHRYSAEDVQNDPVYMRFYMVLGAAWVGVFKGAFPLLGISARDDAIERGNAASALALSGGLMGLTLCFAGGNIGNGPGWWVVLFSGGVASACFFMLWAFVARGSGMAEAVTVERDLAAGIRAAGFLIGSGLILGRGVAGNWISAAATVTDFARQAWPAVPLAFLVSFLERQIRPAATRDLFSLTGAGVLPACVYGVLGGLVIWWLGEWP